MEKDLMTEQKIAHLTFIQNVINRMGQNSFILKGWSIILISALFALSAQGANTKFILIAYFPAIIFWLLDSYFLHQEKLFRKLYEKVASSDIPSNTYTLNVFLVKQYVDSYCSTTLSKNLIIFHGCIISILLIAMFVILN